MLSEWQCSWPLRSTATPTATQRSTTPSKRRCGSAHPSFQALARVPLLPVAGAGQGATKPRCSDHGWAAYSVGGQQQDQGCCGSQALRRLERGRALQLKVVSGRGIAAYSCLVLQYCNIARYSRSRLYCNSYRYRLLIAIAIYSYTGVRPYGHR